MRLTVGRLSLRARLLLIGLVGVALALAIGSVTLYAVLGFVGSRTLDASAEATAADVAALVEQGRLPEPIPVTGSRIVQVLDPEGRVLSASVNADRLTALLRPGEVRAAVAGDPVEVSGARVGLDSPLRVTAREVTGPGPPRTVLVAQEFEDLTRSQHTLRTTLLITYPLLLAVLALIAWRVIGAALRPVEELRSAAERISGSGRDTRLPVPPSRDEIRALALTLNSMLDRLADARARQRAFVADAAHELRSPLTSLLAQLDVASHLGEDTAASADLHAEVTRMSALVEDLLTLARLDADTTPRVPDEPVEVAALLSEVVRRYAGRRVDVRLTDVDDSVVHGSFDALARAVSNLVDNAVRHATGCVEVSGAAAGPRVVLVVDDDGGGIPEADRARVFERFTRLDQARDRDAGGSGLGLAIVREIVHRSGGAIRLGASPAGGLRVELVLPRAVGA